MNIHLHSAFKDVVIDVGYFTITTNNQILFRYVRSVSSVRSGESHRSVGSVNISLDFDEKPAVGKLIV